MLAPGHKIGPYTIHECAGEGGMARVYKVWHDGLHRFEALKTPRGNHGNAPDSAYVTRLLAEARVAANLHHPNIVGIHNVSEPSAEIPFFTMDWVEGLDLAKVLAERGTFSLEETVEVLEPVAAALDYAHEHGIVHRDVKPANILLGAVRGAIVPRVVDFGISRAAEDDEEGATKLTKSGMLVGTPEYMSPEQSGSGAPVDFRTDLYSLAVVAFEMLCGRPPFTAGEGVSRLSILVAHVRDTAPLWDHVPHFPRYSGEVLLRALSKLPDQRYANCRTFLAELKKAAQADGPFTAFIYDENGQRTPFDASRFAPVDAATLMEKPGAATPTPQTPATRPLNESAPTRVETPNEPFLSLGARLSLPRPTAEVEPPPVESRTPIAKVLTPEPAPVADLGTSAASAPKRPVRELQAQRPARKPLLGAAVWVVLGTLIIAGFVAWSLQGRVSNAIGSATKTATTKPVKPKADVEIAKSPVIQPAKKADTLSLRTEMEPRTDEVNFKIVEEPSSKFPVGYRKTKRAGVKGQRKVVVTVTYRGDKQISRDKTSDTVIRASVPQIDVVGTAAPKPTRAVRNTDSNDSPRPRTRRRVVAERPRPKAQPRRRATPPKKSAPRRSAPRRKLAVPLPP